MAKIINQAIKFVKEGDKPTTEREKFALAFRLIAAKEGLSNKELAIKLDLKPSWISQLLTGNAPKSTNYQIYIDKLGEYIIEK